MEKEILRAKLQATPRVILKAIKFSIVLALLIAVRIGWTNQQAGKPLGPGLLAAGLMGFAIVSSSFSLINRNKFGYLLVMITVLLPLLGSFGLSVHALRLLVLGHWDQDRIGMIASLIGLLQFATILSLLTTLVHREARDWVWSSNAAPTPSTPAS